MEPNLEHKTNYDSHRKKGMLGIIVILAGLALLLFNTGFLPYYFRHVLISWPMLLIAIGVVSFIGRENRVPGIILIVIGGFFLIPRVFDLDFNFAQLFWPLILICVGVLILFRKFPHPRNWKNRMGNSPDNIMAANDQGYIFEDHIFSGTEKRIVNKEFKGGRVNVIFGGIKLDFTQAGLAEGNNELEINVVFGGATVIVPCEWKVQLKNTSIFGGFSDKRYCIKDTTDPSRVFIIKASSVFGGGEIKTY
jgi:predicted membrane protein